MKPSTSAFVLDSIEPTYVAPSEPAGPSVSAHSAAPTFAPVSRAIAASTFGFTELSAKIAFTPAVRIVSISSAVSPAEGCPSVESDGMTVPMTSMP